MKAFVSIALAGILATGLTSMVIADDTQTPADSQQAEGAPAKERAGRRAAAATSKSAGAKVGVAAPNFTLKTTDGKEVNVLASDTPKSAAETAHVIAECHESWKALKARGPGDTGFWLGK